MSDPLRPGAAHESPDHPRNDASPEPVDAVTEVRQWLAERGLPVADDAGEPSSRRVGRQEGHVQDRTDRGPRTDSFAPAGGRRSSGRRRSGPASRGAAPDGAAPRGVERDPAEPDADPVSVARTIVLRKLAAQARTRAELSKALQAKEVPEDAAATVLDRMEEVGLIDDQGFARDWVESRQQRRHLSKTALRRELSTKGVDRSQIDTALEQVDPEDELEAAQSLVAKKVRTMGGLDRQVRYRRLAGMLGRRGFGPGVISQVVNEVLDLSEE